MEALIRVKVDDELLRQHVADYCERRAAEGSPFPMPDPVEYVLERLRDVCADELPVALYGWEGNLGLELEVETA